MSGTDREFEVAQVLANMASGYILNATELSDAQEVVGQLQHALDSRVVIEQARGIVAARGTSAPTRRSTSCAPGSFEQHGT